MAPPFILRATYNTARNKVFPLKCSAWISKSAPFRVPSKAISGLFLKDRTPSRKAALSCFSIRARPLAAARPS